MSPINTKVTHREEGDDSPDEFNVTVNVDGVDVKVSVTGWTDVSEALIALAILGERERLLHVASELETALIFDEQVRGE